MVQATVGTSQGVLTKISLAVLLTGLVSGWVLCVPEAEPQFPFQDPEVRVEDRARDLVSRLTLEEKVSQMIYNAPAIDRLSIPAYNWWNECLHGVGRAGLATVFPQAIGLGASWDPAFHHQVATAISDEARSKHHQFLRIGKQDIYQGLTFWTPNINLFRDPRWGRGQETYGEDPYLMSRMAVAFIRGLQGDDPKYLKLVATAKHFAVHSGPEPERHTFDAVIGDRDLWESYLPAFEATVKEANVQSVMCAYNRFRGEAACASDFLLEETLRQKWGFSGYVVSDCGAIYDIFKYHKLVETAAEASALAVQRGTDLNCGSTYSALKEAITQDLLTEADLDRSLQRLFEARIRLGMFDPPELVPWAQIPYSVNTSRDHQDLARIAAQKSIVLLKNKSSTLPLRKDIESIAVIGPNADDPFVLLGNYSGTALHLTTVLDGIRKKVLPTTHVYHATGSPLAEGVPHIEVIPSQYLRPLYGDPTDFGLTGSYFGNSKLEGKSAFSRIDPVINFIWKDTTPVSGTMADEFSVRWEGSLQAPVTGTYHLGVNGLTWYRLHLDDVFIASFDGVHHPIPKMKEIELEAGRFYRIRLEYQNRSSDPQVQLIWAIPAQDREQKALEIAAKSDVIVFAGGLSPRVEGEEMPVKVEGFLGGDRTTLRLPETQDDLLQKLHGLGKPIVLVLFNGSALAATWADEHIPAILSAWYPGQAGGQAIADVLFGDYNPAGRLPVTFYRSVADLPDFGNYDMEGRTYRYFQGQPLYPFGHGLSYTAFAYDNLEIQPQVSSGEDPVQISVTVTNTGSLIGEEVVQLYVTDREASVPVPVRTLAGFSRIRLRPGESRKVEFSLEPRQLSLIDAKSQRVIEPGDFLISIGGKQPGFSGNADASTTSVLSGALTVNTWKVVGLME